MQVTRLIFIGIVVAGLMAFGLAFSVRLGKGQSVAVPGWRRVIFSLFQATLVALRTKACLPQASSEESSRRETNNRASPQSPTFTHFACHELASPSGGIRHF
jgi:hypothetical protein